MENQVPGYKTTEFWFSVISVAAILLKLVGIDVSPEDQNVLATSLAGLVVGFLAVWGIVSRYIKSRSEVKVARVESETVLKLSQNSKQPLTLNYGGSK